MFLLKYLPLGKISSVFILTKVIIPYLTLLPVIPSPFFILYYECKATFSDIQPPYQYQKLNTIDVYFSSYEIQTVPGQKGRTVFFSE